MRARYVVLPVALAALLAAAAAPAQDTAITGFVDASYFQDLAAKGGEFGLDQAEIDIEHRSGDRTMVRADLEWVKNGETFDAQVEQAFVRYTCPADWTLTFGRFNAPIGFEQIDPNEMYQFSHALVYTYGQPTNLTGIMVDRPIGERVTVTAFGVNGWDQNAESNALKTWGGRLDYTHGVVDGGIVAITGKEGGGAAPEFDRTVLDADLACTPEGWVLGADLNHGKVTEAGGAEATWFGFMVMAHRDFNSWLGLTMRADYLDDQDGLLFGPVGGEVQKRNAIAIAPTFVLDEGFGALVELRIDKSDQDAFLDSDGLPTDTSTSVAFEMTYAF
ncbi:MAG TPA: porin [Candidatus Krumholzibacteria bacterium]|nr:porin [Candidatus Krumholzibacteria bacterium]